MDKKRKQDELASKEFLMSVLTNPESCSRKIINQLHMNKDYPENGSARITNRKLRYAEIYTENGWKVKDKTQLCFNLINKGDDTIDQFIEENRDDIPEDIMELFEKYADGPRFLDLGINAKEEIEIDLINWTRYMLTIKYLIANKYR